MKLSLDEPAATPRADEQTWRFGNGHGELRMRVVAPRLLVITMIGRADVTPVGAFVAAVPQIPSDGLKQSFFFDLSQLEHYESSFRVAMTDWLMQRRSRAAVHCLFRSKLVAMGVSVVNLAVGGIITPYSARAPFQAAFTRAQHDLAATSAKI